MGELRSPVRRCVVKSMKLAAILIAFILLSGTGWAALTVGKMPRERGVAVSFQEPPKPVINWVLGPDGGEAQLVSTHAK